MERDMESLRALVLPIFDRMMLERFPDTYQQIPDALINFVVEDVHRDSAWQTEGRFTDADVSRAIQDELMICVHEILGREPTQRYRQQWAQKESVGGMDAGAQTFGAQTSDAQIFDALDIKEMSPFDALHDIAIGDRNIVMGAIQGGKYSGQYMCSLRHHENGRFTYTHVTISQDYFKVLDAFARRVAEQADRTRQQITAPLMENVNGAEKVDLTPIGANGCKPLSEDDTLAEKVVVIRADVLRPEYRHPTFQLRLCTGGFGAYPYSRGRACFCKSLVTGEEGRFERDDILGTIARDKLPTWARDKLAEIEKPKQKDGEKDNAKGKGKGREKGKGDAR